MQLRWALWAMAIGSSSSSVKASPPSSPGQKKKKTEKVQPSSSSRRSGTSSSRRSLFRKSGSSAAEGEASEGEAEEKDCDDDEEQEGQSLRWAADALLPRLRALEAALLDRAVSGLWSRALDAVRAEEREVAATASGQPGLRRPSSTSGGLESSGGGIGGGIGGGTPYREDKAEEAAGRWVDVLRSAARDAASSARASVPGPHASLFVSRVLGLLLDRVDALLCEAATGVREEEEEEEEENDKGVETGGGGGGGAGAGKKALLLPASFLPFDPRYPLTFTSGVGIKLAVGKIGLWAADAGAVVGSSSSSSSSGPNGVATAAVSNNGAVDENGDDGTENGGDPNNHLPRLFPRLRAVADLLMMPKDALADPSARLDVLPFLSLKSVCGALGKFRPDDHAPDPLPPGLLDVLREQAEDELEEERESKKEKRSLRALLRAALAPVPERAMLARGLVPEPLSLEQSPESEDELDELEGAVGGGGGTGGSEDSVRGTRFDLLRELWSSAR